LQVRIAKMRQELGRPICQYAVEGEDEEFEPLKKKLRELLEKLGPEEPDDQARNSRLLQEVWTNFRKLEQAYSLPDAAEWLAPLVLIACDRSREPAQPAISALRLARLSQTRYLANAPAQRCCRH